MTYMSSARQDVAPDASPSASTVDPRARLEAIYVTEGPRLRALGTLLTGNPPSGEDLAQSVLTEALRRELDRPGYLRDPVWPWLRAVAIRMAGRTRARQRAYWARIPLLGGTLSDTDWREETIDTVRALRKLPPRMRMCIVLAYLEDQSTEAIAQELNCAPKTVENQLREGRRRLRELIDRE